MTILGPAYERGPHNSLNSGSFYFLWVVKGEGGAADGAASFF
jgi:hypothetical protein